MPFPKQPVRSLQGLSVIFFFGWVGCGKTPLPSGSESQPPSTFRSSESDNQGKADSLSVESEVDRKPTDGELQSPVGNLTEDFDQATRVASDLVERMANQFPDDPDAKEVKARYYFLIGNLEVAEACWQDALAKSSEYGYAFDGLGKIAFKRSDYAQAAEYFSKAAKLMPNNSLPVHGLSDALLKQGEIEQAILVLERENTEHKKSRSTLLLLGQAYMANRDYQNAKVAFEEALAIDANNAPAIKGLGIAHQRLGNKPEAAMWLARVQSDRSKENLSVSEEAQRIDIAVKLVDTARVYIKYGKLEDAVFVLRQAALFDPKSEDSRKTLVDVFLKLERPAAAIEFARQLLDLSPKNGNYILSLGSLYSTQKNWPEAESTYQRLVALAPESPVGYEALAHLFITSQTDMDKAIAMAKRVTELRGAASDFATYSQSLAINGRIPEAIQAMQQAIEKDPESRNFVSLLNLLKSSQIPK